MKMHFNIFVICAFSFFVHVDNNCNCTPPVEVIHTPAGTDVFCFLVYGRWAKPIYFQETFPNVQAQRIGHARLPNHRLDFTTLKSQKAGGNLPTIVPDCGYEVWGAFYFVPMTDLNTVVDIGSTVDNKKVFQFVQNTVEAYYEGKTTPVNMKCNSFQQIDLPEKLIYGLPLPEDRRPSQKMRDGMVEAFTDAGIPQKYIDQISQLPIKGQN